MNNKDNSAGDRRTYIRKAAHDVRTPLTSIAGFAQLLIEDVTLSADARENAETILDEANRLSEMLETFFDEMTQTFDAEAPKIDEL